MAASLIKKLAGQTAVYGVPNIVGRFLNYLLVPLHTQVFADPSYYGVITVMYAYASFLMIALAYGTETAYFRFIQKHPEGKVFSTLMASLLLSGGLFVLLCFVFSDNLATIIGYTGYGQYVQVFALILFFDSLSALALARLRQFDQAKSFAGINLLGIGLNIGLNLLIILVVYPYAQNNPDWAFSEYFSNQNNLIYTIFLANLAQSLLKILAAFYVAKKHAFEKVVWRFLPQLWKYGGVIAIIGLMGILNETADRIFLKELLSQRYGETFADTQVGIYGANYKLAMLVSLFVQAFRFAAEPLFFKSAADGQKRDVLATVLNYFTAFALVIALVISFNLGLFKHFIQNESYHSGLRAVPILLLANVFFGVSINLSIWYKMSKKTYLGLIVAFAGALVTIFGNFLFIPSMSYMASAYSTLACYAIICLVSYLMSRKYYPIPYQVGKIALLFALALGIYFGLNGLFNSDSLLHFGIKNAGIILFALLAYSIIKRPRRVKH